ncbi:MAG: zinc ribbon domain-containing protein [Chloroflexi bacterium]|nr:zinc ribbon domain-containing protein [Chloroflexota bacterium]
MPIYQYECEKCGHKFELRRKIGEGDNELKCPKCGAGNPQRDFSELNTCSPNVTWAPRGGG